MEGEPYDKVLDDALWDLKAAAPAESGLSFIILVERPTREGEPGHVEGARVIERYRAIRSDRGAIMLLGTMALAQSELASAGLGFDDDELTDPEEGTA